MCVCMYYWHAPLYSKVWRLFSVVRVVVMIQVTKPMSSMKISPNA